MLTTHTETVDGENRLKLNQIFCSSLQRELEQVISDWKMFKTAGTISQNYFETRTKVDVTVQKYIHLGSLKLTATVQKVYYIKQNDAYFNTKECKATML